MKLIVALTVCTDPTYNPGRSFLHWGVLLENGDFLFDGNWQALDNGLYCYSDDDSEENQILTAGSFEIYKDLEMRNTKTIRELYCDTEKYSVHFWNGFRLVPSQKIYPQMIEKFKIVEVDGKTRFLDKYGYYYEFTKKTEA